MNSTKQVKYARPQNKTALKESGQPIEPRRSPVIVLIGFMGGGKTTLGKALARALGEAFVDLDREIERTQKSSVPQIFTELGERRFREVESKILEKNLKKGGVIAAGGGLVTRNENFRLLRESGALVVWINPAWKELWRRLQGLRDGERPLLTEAATGKPRSQASVRKLWSQRRPAYRKFAELILFIKAGERESASARSLAHLVTRRTRGRNGRVS